jgi:hypothetical protein
MLDRAGIIELLGRLGAENDATVLEAARALHRKVEESGVSWDDLLRRQPDVAGSRAGLEAEDPPLEAAPSKDAPLERAGAASTAERAEAVRIIDRLLARKNLSSNLREDLAEFKQTLSEGNLDAADSRYLRALAKRLGA